LRLQDDTLLNSRRIGRLAFARALDRGKDGDEAEGQQAERQDQQHLHAGRQAAESRAEPILGERPHIPLHRIRAATRAGTRPQF
jgi:hypothetical protein